MTEENPYSYAVPGNKYVGNVDLRRRVVRGVMRQQEHFAILGGRRCGKTSTLSVLKDDLANAERSGHRRTVVPLVISEMEFEHEVSPNVLFRRILEGLTEGLSGFCWDAVAQEAHPYRAFRRNVAGEVSAALAESQGQYWLAAIMMDEIDALAERLERAGHGDVFFKNLRHLVMEDPLHDRFRLVVTGVNDVAGLIRSGSPLNMLAKLELGVLRDQDVDELVGVGFADGIPVAAKARLVELTGRHPYLLQGVLQTLWPPGGVGVDSEQVERAAISFQREHDDFRRWLTRFGEVARTVYGYLSARPDGIASLSKLVGALPPVAGNAVSGYDIERALSALATHGVIEAEGDDCRIAGTMFRDWFHSHAPVATGDVIDVLDRLEELVNELPIPIGKRRGSLEWLAKAREMFGRDGESDPGEIRQKVSEALRRLWEGVKEAKEAAQVLEVLIKVVPHLGAAAAWLGPML